ncbi:hypothetical protein OG689_43115 [Kitasatospora sp. NBC_00240]|uniref:hypothetical protein n=1 Tax=Kitasatospora sp. NBC_00240 TaxID=2903567 RepID=UPI00224CE0E4|nr:hypothetical protein [Kitasatospora sp. NBC_00240]MCX5215933.1 hypothetical protein [Kitasatospora sp. NBC_00240]
MADDPRPFDAVLNADASHPNGLWLFKGSEYYLYDLLDDAVVEGPIPLTQPWGAGALPQLFRSGIHSAVWSGPAFPNLWTFFKDEMYYSMDAVRGWAQAEGPRGILGAWAAGVWAAPDGTWMTPGVPVALHGMGTRFDGMIHFFKDGKYVRHNLRTGSRPEAGPIPIGEEWDLPEMFLDRIDYAFYGTGAHEEDINFISGENYVLYDFRRRQVIDQGPVAKRFPVFAQFIDRPQLFLAEDYDMATLVGPVSLGRLIDTRSIGAGSKIQKFLVTETTDTSLQNLRQSMLDSQDTQVTEDFYDRLDTNLSSDESSDSYRYQLNAQFHGEAGATSLWGGEVNADLNAQGQTETVRSSLSQAAFKSIGSQLEQTRRETHQKTYDSLAEISSTVHVLKKEFFEETNASDRVRVYEFYEQLQSYITLLVLRGVVLVYSDGVTRPKTAQLPGAQRLLEDVLADPQEVARVIDYLRQELSNVTGHDGQVHSLLESTPPDGGLALRNNMTSRYTVVLPDGSQQDVSQAGLIKAAHSWVEPTFTITPVQT